VDPRLRSRLWAAFRKLAEEGATLFISTHLMDEAVLCDRVSVLRGGAVIASDPPRELLRRGGARLTIRSRQGEDKRLIGGRPEDLAEALRPYGLSPDVGAVGVEADSLESVVLSIIGEER
jgi:ABC-2 type transport system ATP-binding protein